MMFRERVSPGPQISQTNHVVLVAGGQMLIKPHLLIHLTDYALSLPHQRVFYALASCCPSQRTLDYSKRRGLIACVQTKTPTANFWDQIISDPYRRPLTLTYLLVSTRGLFQDMVFERLHDSTFSEDASEVIVQPLPCGIEKANSMARVVVKLTPRLCNRCARYTLIHSGGAGLRILGRILDLLLAKKDLSAPLMILPAEYLGLKVRPSCHR